MLSCCSLGREGNKKPALHSGRMAGDLPAGWELRQSHSSGKSYFYNTFTGGTQWEKPAPIGAGQVARVKLQVVRISQNALNAK